MREDLTGRNESTFGFRRRLGAFRRALLSKRGEADKDKRKIKVFASLFLY